MPWASAGLLSAQSARSTPASASARACATASWLLAIVGSMADITEKPAMRAERITRLKSAIGRATPRSLPKDDTAARADRTSVRMVIAWR